MAGTSTRYPTGTDYKIYLTDPLRAPGQQDFTGGALPGFEDMKPLDVKNVTIVEDGQVTPLYDISRQTADHFAYSRRLVNGSLQFNFSEEHMERHRSPFQSLRDKTMWVVLDYRDWSPLRRVRDIYRIGAVWEHAFRHEPQPHAAEQVPFSGRDLTLINRQTNRYDEGALNELSRSGGDFEIEADDLFRERKNRYLASVVSVTDGDSVHVRLDSTGDEINIRLAGVDTMEKPLAEKDNPSRGEISRWWWPDSAPRPSDYSGPENDPVHPSESQLDQWGLFVREQARKWLPQGTKVWVVTDQGTAPVGDFGRYIFRIDPLQPITSTVDGKEIKSTNLGEHLTKMGYAVPYASDSITLSGGMYENLSARIDALFGDVRSSAGTDEGRGVFYHPDVSKWKSFAGL